MERVKKFAKKPITWILVVAVILVGAVAVWRLMPAPQDAVSGEKGTGVGVSGQQAAAEADKYSSGVPAPNEPDSGSTGTPVIGEKLTWAAINSYPIKTASMSVAEMRDYCVDFFRFSKTALWTPKETFTFFTKAPENETTNQYQSSEPMYTMRSSTIYGGLPYITLGSGSVYRLMDHMDEATGKVDVMKYALGNGDTSQVLRMDQLAFFGNQCSISAYWGWGRVINSPTYWWTQYMVPSNGIIMHGEYPGLAFDINTLAMWQNPETHPGGHNTVEVCDEENDNHVSPEQMYANYALIKKADGLVNYTTGGHVMMSAADAHVVKSGGKIDGDKSYITVIDQAGPFISGNSSAGDIYWYEANVDTQISFAELYADAYLPFTFQEFQGQDDVEETTYSFSHTGSTITKSQLFASTVESNYGISDVYAIVTNENDEEVYRHTIRSDEAGLKQMYFIENDSSANNGGNHVETQGALSAGTYNIEIVAQLSTGERPTLYVGTLKV